MKPRSRIDNIIFGGILTLLVFAPLAFGSVHVWAYSLIQFGVFVLLGLWAVDRLLLAKAPSVGWVQTPINLLMILLILWIVVQTIPLPSALISVLSPRTFADKATTLITLSNSPDQGSQISPWLSITYSVHPLINELLKIVTYFGMFFLVLNTIQSKRQIDILVYTLILVGAFEAVYAVYQVFAENPKVWWWQSRFGKAQRASGTFIGANHFAAYLNLIVCLAFGFLISQKGKARRMLSGLGGIRATFQRAVSLFAPESAQSKIIVILFLAIVMGVSILMSGSRGGIVSLGLALLMVALLFTTKRKYRKFGLLAIVFCLLIAGYGFQIGIDPTLERFKQTQGLHDRLAITRSILPMMANYPVLGLGLGNFKYLYPRYIVDKDQVSSSGYAHNDWVEAGIELGFIGIALVLAGVIIFLVRSLRLWHRRRNLHALGIGAGVLAGLISISFHSYFDFNMHIPANPLTLAALLAIGYAALHRQGHGYSESFFYRKRTLALTPVKSIILATAILLFISSLLFWTWRHAIAEAACPTEWNSTLNLKWSPELEEIETAISRNAINFEYHHKRALYFMAKDAGDNAEKEAFLAEARRSLEQAVSLNPARGMLWYKLGNIYSYKRKDLVEYLNAWLPQADECYDMAVQCAPMDKHLLFSIGRYWVWRSQLLPEKVMPVQRGTQQVYKQDIIKKFQGLFQRYLELDPDNWHAVFNMVWEAYPQDRIVFGVVPPDNDTLKSRVLKEAAKRELN